MQHLQGHGWADTRGQLSQACRVHPELEVGRDEKIDENEKPCVPCGRDVKKPKHGTGGVYIKMSEEIERRVYTLSHCIVSLLLPILRPDG